jgi:hypothetical protein
MEDDNRFRFFDQDQGFQVRRGHLPHWYQPDATYFVTFRTDDSVPQDLVRAWQAMRADWLCRHGIDPRVKRWKSVLRGRPRLEREYHARFTRRFMEYLDRGLGVCVLRDPAAATIVVNSLGRFDGDRYHLGDFVIMPNHVHVLVCLLGDTEIESLCASWKHYTAREINRLFRKSGRFWQEESFDHLVRSPAQFHRFCAYIADNPRRAGLAPGSFLLRSLL